MRLQNRFIGLLGLILLSVGLTVWFGVRPGYEAAILSERITIASEQQRERIDVAEQQLGQWMVMLSSLQENLRTTGDINQARLLFSGYTALLPELIGVRLIEQSSGEFVELRSVGSPVLPEAAGITLHPIGSTAALRYPNLEARNMYLGWKLDKGYILLTTVFNLDDESFRLIGVFRSLELEQILLDDALGGDAQSVLWFRGQEDGISRNAMLPDVRPDYEPVTRFREMTVNDRPTVVLSSPIPTLDAQHVIYMDPALIRGPIRTLFTNSMLILVMAFVSLTIASIVVFNQLSKPVNNFIKDIQPIGKYDFSKPIRTSAIPELRELTEKLEEIRNQLAYYERINVEKIIVNQESLNLMMEYASDPIAVFDADGVFTFRNNRFVDLFLHADLPAPGNINDFDAAQIISVTKSQEPEEYRVRPLTVRNEGCEITVQTGDDEKSYVYDQQRISIYNESGGLVGGQLLLFDLTRERELDQLRTDMINIIIHELKNPIAGIRGLTSALIEDPDFEEDEINEIYRLIDNSAESFQELVERFLQVSRLESSLAHIERNPVYLPDVIRAVASEMSIILAEKKLRFDIKIDENIEPVMASYELFQDMVRNLLSNAIKYGGRDRTIDIELIIDTFGYNQSDLLFQVTDYGFGIPEEHTENIFKKFYRIKAYDLEKGTGLGLSHVREIVRHHDGVISFESNAEIGTRFTVRLPYKPLVNLEVPH